MGNGTDNTVRDMTLETRLSRLLTISTAVAGLTTLAGMVMHLWRHHADTASFRSFVPTDLADLHALLPRLAQFEPRALIQAGVLLLVLTPVARVAATLIAFAARRDWLYVAVTLAVLGTLVAGLAGFRF